MDILSLFQLLRRRKWIVILCILLSGAASLIISAIIPPKYAGVARVMVKTDSGGGISFSNTILAQFGGAAATLPTNDYAEMLKGWSLLQETNARLGLPTDPNSSEFGDMQKSISIQPLEGTNLMEIRYLDRDPVMAAKLVNELIVTLSEHSLDSGRSSANYALSVVREELAMQRIKLQEAEKALESFKKETKIILPDASMRAYMDALSSLDRQRVAAEVELVQAEARLKKLEAETENQEAMVMYSRVVTNNPIVSQYRSRLAEKEVELANLLMEYTEAHPNVIAVKQQIESIKKELSQQTEQIISSETYSENPILRTAVAEIFGIRTEIYAGEAALAVIRQKISELERGLGDLPETELKLARLTREKLTAEQICVALEQKETEYRLSGEVNQGEIRVVDHAFVPQQRAIPRTKLNLAVALVLGAFLGLGLAKLADLFEMKPSPETKSFARRAADDGPGL